MNKKNKKKIFIIAGELSGDHHGAKLMYHIKQYELDTTFFGLGGPKKGTRRPIVFGANI